MPIDKGYAAGILDGEGTISIRKKKGLCKVPFNYQLVVSLSNTSEEIIQRLHQEYRGSVRPIKPRSKKHSLSYQLTLTGIQARRLLRETLPFLIIKGQQARLALSLPSTPRGEEVSPSAYTKQREIYQKVKLLNTRGPKAEQLLMSLKETQDKLF